MTWAILYASFIAVCTVTGVVAATLIGHILLTKILSRVLRLEVAIVISFVLVATVLLAWASVLTRGMI